MNDWVCSRCGKCCETATICDLRGHMLPGNFLENAKITPPCDQLVRHEDGTTSCNVIIDMKENPLRWDERGRRYYLDVFLGSGCANG